MRAFLRRRPVVMCCVAAALVLVLGLSIYWSFPRPDPQINFDRVQAGMTEEEVEAIYGPPITIGRDPRTWDGTPVRARRDTAAGTQTGELTTIKTEKQWWYDDEHVFGASFDERGILACKSGPGISPPRSAFKRWWRNQVREIHYMWWVIWNKR